MTSRMTSRREAALLRLTTAPLGWHENALLVQGGLHEALVEIASLRTEGAVVRASLSVAKASSDSWVTAAANAAQRAVEVGAERDGLSSRVESLQLNKAALLSKVESLRFHNGKLADERNALKAKAALETYHNAETGSLRRQLKTTRDTVHKLDVKSQELFEEVERWKRQEAVTNAAAEKAEGQRDKALVDLAEMRSSRDRLHGEVANQVRMKLNWRSSAEAELAASRANENRLREVNREMAGERDAALAAGESARIEPWAKMVGEIASLKVELAEANRVQDAFKAEVIQVTRVNDRLTEQLGDSGETPERISKLAVSIAEAKESVFLLASQNQELRDLVLHCWIHSGYPECGYIQMTRELKALYDKVKRERIVE